MGEALADVISRGIVTREELFITSKLWVSKAHVETAAAALAKTLADLRLAYVDLYLVHWPFRLRPTCTTLPPPMEDRLGYSPEEFLKVWRVLEGEVDAGRARAIGVSNMTVKKLGALLAEARVKPANNQVELHPFMCQAELLAYCAAHGITVTAFSPLGSPARPARMQTESDPAPMHDESVKAVAAAHGKNAAQVLIRWAIQRGTICIPKSVTPARIVENAAVFDFELTPEEMAKISGLDAGYRLNKGMPWLLEGQVWQDNWDEPRPSVSA